MPWGEKMNKASISSVELSVLRFIGGSSVANSDRSISEISEIAVGTGLRDSEEVQRALYLLEGKRLVRPEPEGDFTSNHWLITESGLKALDLLQL
jgi:hypothetical protein